MLFPQLQETLKEAKALDESGRLGAEVEDAVIMGGAVIESGAVVKHCIVAENVVIGQNAVVGEMPHDGEKGVASIGSGIHIGERAIVGPIAMVNANVMDGEEEW